MAKTTATGNRVHCSFSVPQHTKERLKAIAEAWYTSPSRAVERLVDEQFDQLPASGETNGASAKGKT